MSGSDGWELGQGVFHGLCGPEQSPQPQGFLEAGPAMGALLPEVMKVEPLALL